MDHIWKDQNPTLVHLPVEDTSEMNSCGEKGEQSHFPGDRRMPDLSHGSLMFSLGYYTQCHCNNILTSGSSDVIYTEQLCNQPPLQMSDKLFQVPPNCSSQLFFLTKILICLSEDLPPAWQMKEAIRLIWHYHVTWQHQHSVLLSVEKRTYKMACWQKASESLFEDCYHSSFWIRSQEDA